MDAVTGAPPLRRVPSLRQVSRVADADASSTAEIRAAARGLALIASDVGSRQLQNAARAETRLGDTILLVVVRDDHSSVNSDRDF